MFLQNLFRSVANAPVAVIESTRTERQLPREEFLERIALALREANPGLAVNTSTPFRVKFDQFILQDHPNNKALLRLYRSIPDSYVVDKEVMDFYTHEFNVGVVAQRLLKCVKDRKEEALMLENENLQLSSLVRGVFNWCAGGAQRSRFVAQAKIGDDKESFKSLNFHLAEYTHRQDNRIWIVERDPNHPRCIRLYYNRADGKSVVLNRSQIKLVPYISLLETIEKSAKEYDQYMRDLTAKEQAVKKVEAIEKFKATIADLKAWLVSLRNGDANLEMITGGDLSVDLNFNLRNWPSEVWYLEKSEARHDLIVFGHYVDNAKQRISSPFWLTEKGLGALKVDILDHIKSHIQKAEGIAATSVQMPGDFAWIMQSTANGGQETFFKQLTDKLSELGFTWRKETAACTKVWLPRQSANVTESVPCWKIADGENGVTVSTDQSNPQFLGMWPRTAQSRILAALTQYTHTFTAEEFLSQLWAAMQGDRSCILDRTDLTDLMVEFANNKWQIFKNDIHMIVAQNATSQFWYDTRLANLFTLREMLLADEKEKHPVRWLAMLNKMLIDKGCKVKRQYEMGRLSKLIVDVEPNSLMLSLDHAGSHFLGNFAFDNSWAWRDGVSEASINRLVDIVTSWNQLTAIFQDLKKSGLNIQRPSYCKLVLPTSQGEISLGTYGAGNEVIRVTATGLDGGFENYLNNSEAVPKICSIIKSLVAKQIDSVGDGLWALMKRLQELQLPVETKSGTDGRLTLVAVRYGYDKIWRACRGPASGYIAVEHVEGYDPRTGGHVVMPAQENMFAVAQAIAKEYQQYRFQA